jgi:hypothetical protein
MPNSHHLHLLPLPVSVPTQFLVLQFTPSRNPFINSAERPSYDLSYRSEAVAQTTPISRDA